MALIVCAIVEKESKGSKVCDPNPCQNGGLCVGEGSRHKCLCEDGYEGVNCETGEIASCCCY